MNIDLKSEELKKLSKFEDMLKEIFFAFPYLKSIKITNVGKETVQDFRARAPEHDSRSISVIDLETKNKKFSELNYIDQKEKYEEIINKNNSSKDLNKLVTIAALDTKLIKKKILYKETKNHSEGNEYIFTSENIKEYLLNREFSTNTNKKLGSDEFKKLLSQKPKLF